VKTGNPLAKIPNYVATQNGLLLFAQKDLNTSWSIASETRRFIDEAEPGLSISRSSEFASFEATTFC
jgi:hypothetical protein